MGGRFAAVLDPVRERIELGRAGEDRAAARRSCKSTHEPKRVCLLVGMVSRPSCK